MLLHNAAFPSTGFPGWLRGAPPPSPWEPPPQSLQIALSYHLLTARAQAAGDTESFKSLRAVKTYYLALHITLQQSPLRRGHL